MTTKNFSTSRSRQSGVALPTVLILLIIITVLGLASLRGTLMDERMAANAFDRQLGFQQAENALRAAEDLIGREWLASAARAMAAGYNCTTASATCPSIPSNAYTGNVTGVSAANCPGTQNCWRDITGGSAAANVTGTPQYYIEYMGKASTTDNENMGLGSNADPRQYGGGSSMGGDGMVTSYMYRVTARNFDPSLSANAGRALVVVQSNVMMQ